ncbi:ATP synthase epsilon chain [Dissostichus eleginoides]|uniref:ATP synthase epsilon chain n=1 Tax=Dissostichus eleginoides TaxID=100907 RepID=A0AAD9BPT6_DISEL|nr:ATP synthase epsilon chain [Dissostichus eleginoides]
MSGEYSCQYKTAKVYWFLRLRGEGYRQQVFMDNSGIIVVAVFTGVLLVFSVVGSVYVFRGHGSLESRPRSIYDVLDHSAAKKEPNQRKAKPKKKEPQEKMPQTPQDQNEGTFECVYENF